MNTRKELGQPRIPELWEISVTIIVLELIVLSRPFVLKDFPEYSIMGGAPPVPSI